MICMHKKNQNNSGYTLVELIVVIAIMSIFVGGMSLGVNLLFSKDASRCATRLNDALYEARMNSMSKVGNYELVIEGGNSASVNTATLNADGSEVIKYYLDEIESSKKTDIEATLATESNPSGQSIALPVTIKFDKAKGNVKVLSGGTELDDGILIFKIKANRGNREAKVQLVTTTGKHTIGEFE